MQKIQIIVNNENVHSFLHEMGNESNNELQPWSVLGIRFLSELSCRIFEVCLWCESWWADSVALPFLIIFSWHPPVPEELVTCSAAWDSQNREVSAPVSSPHYFINMDPFFPPDSIHEWVQNAVQCKCNKQVLFCAPYLGFFLVCTPVVFFTRHFSLV